MDTNEKDALDVLLFGTDGVELADFKCFRGDSVDISEADIREQVHSAFMQRRMKRAHVSPEAPRPDVTSTNVREFVEELKQNQ